MSDITVINFPKEKLWKEFIIIFFLLKVLKSAKREHNNTVMQRLKTYQPQHTSWKWFFLHMKQNSVSDPVKYCHKGHPKALETNDEYFVLA